MLLGTITRVAMDSYDKRMATINIDCGAIASASVWKAFSA